MPSRNAARVVVPALAAALALAACTGDTTPTGSTSSSSSTVSESPIPSGPIDFVPGEYFLDEADVQARLSWDGGTGTLEVTNNSEDPIGAPTLYAVTQDQQQVDATVDGGSIAPGDSTTVEVVFPDALTPPDVGLLVIGFGDISYGVIPPVVADV
jgi:hypothetical protein